MILVIDNYDSFTFNLVQALEAAGADVRVLRNDRIDRAGIAALAADEDAGLRGIVVSPGPADPDRCRRIRGRRARRDRAIHTRCSASASGCSRWPRRSERPSSGLPRSSTARHPR